MEISIFGQKNTGQVGVILEMYPVKIKSFPFVPIGSRKHSGNCRHDRFTAGNQNSHQHPAVLATQTIEIIDDFELLTFKPVDSGDGFEKEAFTVHDPRHRHHLLHGAADIEMVAVLGRVGDHDSKCPPSGNPRFTFGWCDWNLRTP